MRRALAAALLLAACGGAAQGPVVQAPTAGQSAAAKAVPAEVPPSWLLSRTPDEAEVLLRLSVARAHPLGPTLEPFVLAWPGWGATIRRISPHPVAELDWIDIVGPRDSDKERLAARTVADDAAIDGRLATGGDGSLRLVVRGQPHLVIAVPPDAALGLTAMLGSTHVVDPPAEADEGLRVELPHPHTFFHQIPDEARSGTLRVYGRPGGAAEGQLDLVCDDESAATRLADDLRDQAASANNMVVRLVTLDLLGGLSVHPEGHTARLRLPASRDQLQALARLASAMLPSQPSP